HLITVPLDVTRFTYTTLFRSWGSVYQMTRRGGAICQLVRREHNALVRSSRSSRRRRASARFDGRRPYRHVGSAHTLERFLQDRRSEEHTSELQSSDHIVCMYS